MWRSAAARRRQSCCTALRCTHQAGRARAVGPRRWPHAEAAAPVKESIQQGQKGLVWFSSSRCYGRLHGQRYLVPCCVAVKQACSCQYESDAADVPLLFHSKTQPRGQLTVWSLGLCKPEISLARALLLAMPAEHLRAQAAQTHLTLLAFQQSSQGTHLSAPSKQHTLGGGCAWHGGSLPAHALGGDCRLQGVSP